MIAKRPIELDQNCCGWHRMEHELAGDNPCVLTIDPREWFGRGRCCSHEVTSSAPAIDRSELNVHAQ